jgi:hypothetical protein
MILMLLNLQIKQNAIDTVVNREVPDSWEGSFEETGTSVACLLPSARIRTLSIGCPIG